MIEAVPVKHRGNFGKVMENNRVILGKILEEHDKIFQFYYYIFNRLGVMSSGQRVDVKKLAKFCEEQQNLILKGFPGHKILFPPTVHELYAHLPSMIGKNILL